jgi:hypothetical protein
VTTDLPPERKRAIRRRIMREILAREGLKKLPRRQRLLLTGAQGSGKTRTVLEAVAALPGNVIVWLTEPTTSKAVEVATAYREIAGPNSLPAMVVRGRSANDPRHPSGVAMCLRSAVVEEAAKRGVPIRRAICPKCPRKDECGYMRQDAEIEALGDRALFFLSREYLFLPCPAPNPDLLIADECVTIAAIDEAITLRAATIEQLQLYRGGWHGALANAITAGETLTALHAALRTPQPLAALRDAGVTTDDLRFARHIVESAIVDRSKIVHGRMTDEQISAAIVVLEEDNAEKVLELLNAVLRETSFGRDTLTGVVYLPEHGDKAAHVVVHHLRPMVSIGSGASVLALDGTGSPLLNAALFPHIEHIHIPITRTAHVTGTLGRSYSRQSLTGEDRNGNAIPSKHESSMRVRQEIAVIAGRLTGPVLIASNKAAAKKLEQSTHSVADACFAHFGEVRGLNVWEDCRSVVVAGRESVVEAAENLARAYMALDSAPFVSAAIAPPPNWPWPHWPYRATRGRRMASGCVQAVEVEVHPDPRVQEVLEQVREAEIIQAADRVRPIFNERTIVLMNNLALDVTYDRVLSHADLAAGGTRWDRAWAANGIIPLGASDLHRVHPREFPTVDAARIALKRELGYWGQSSNRDSIWSLSPIKYRVKGRRGPAGRVLVDLSRHADPRATVEAVLGLLAWFGWPNATGE